MRRVVTLLYVVFCFEMGVLLFVFPWLPLWSRNFFVSHYAWFSSIALNHFVRGAVSGVGLADIWLAVFELWRLRRQLGLLSSPPLRRPSIHP